MTPEREYEILHHAYGRSDGRLTVLPGRWATHADGTDLMGCSLLGAWIYPGLEYWPASDELVITPDEAGILAQAKIIAWEPGFKRVTPTARGRDHWNKVKS